MDPIARFNDDEPRLPTSKWDYQVVTPMMEEMLSVVSGEVDRRAPGTAMYGNSRIGKTRAIDYVKAQMRAKYPRLTILHDIMVARKFPSDSRFFKNLATALELSVREGADGDDLRTELIRQILMRCSNARDSRVLILLDEAQRIRPIEYSYLIDLTNHLEKYGMSPIVILCGQPELLDRREELRAQRRRDAIGRFLENPIALTGMSDEEQIKAVMLQYDDSSAMEFPPQSGICITAAYAPQVYQHGSRISHSADMLWKAMSDIADPIIRSPTIGMQCLTRTIELGLIEMATRGDRKIKLDKATWREMLEEAGYSQHLFMTHDLPVDNG